MDKSPHPCRPCRLNMQERHSVRYHLERLGRCADDFEWRSLMKARDPGAWTKWDCWAISISNEAFQIYSLLQQASNSTQQIHKARCEALRVYKAASGLVFWKHSMPGPEEYEAVKTETETCIASCKRLL